MDLASPAVSGTSVYANGLNCAWNMSCHKVNISSVSQDISKIIWTPSFITNQKLNDFFFTVEQSQHISCKRILVLTTLNMATSVAKTCECLLCNKICSYTPSKFVGLLKKMYICHYHAHKSLNLSLPVPDEASQCPGTLFL